MTPVLLPKPKEKDHFEVRRQVILLRQSMSQFLKDYSKTHPEAKKAYCINQQSLSKELRKMLLWQFVVAIMIELFQRVSLHYRLYLLCCPFYILKLLIQFILSTCLVAPYKIILKQPR